MPKGDVEGLAVPEKQVLVYQLVKDRFFDAPLSTEGARHYVGCWNPSGVGILYTSASPELVLLQQLVHSPEFPFEILPKLSLLTQALPDPPKE